MAKKRKKLSRNKSRKLFRAGARHIKGKNLRAVPMRGGFRL